MSLLTLRGLTIRFGQQRVVDDMSLDLEPGHMLALVGESGSGKSVTALSLMRLIEREGGRLDGGRIAFQLDENRIVYFAGSTDTEMQHIRGNHISMIFQEPMTSLNPVLTVGDQICETLIHHKRLSQADALGEACELLDRVRLSDPEQRLSQYPHELSGGMR